MYSSEASRVISAKFFATEFRGGIVVWRYTRAVWVKIEEVMPLDADKI